MGKEIDAGLSERFRFSIGKIKKLYPLHILTMLIALVRKSIGGAIFYSALRAVIDCGIIGLHMLLLQAWIPREGVYFSLNSVSWYLCVCFFLYFMFSCLLERIRGYQSGRDAVRWIILIVIIQMAAGYASTFLHIPTVVSMDFTKWLTYVCPLYRLGDFAIGCNLGYLFIIKEKDRRKPYLDVGASVLELLALAAGIGASASVAQQLASGWCRTTLIYLPSSALLIWLFARKQGLISGFLTNEVIGRVRGAPMLS